MILLVLILNETPVHLRRTEDVRVDILQQEAF